MRRKPYELKTGKSLFCSRECVSVNQTKVKYNEMCERVGGDFETWLNQKYNVEKLNSREMAILAYGKVKNSPNITGWMKKLKVPVRSGSEAVSMSWGHDEERKKLQSIIAVEHMGVGTPGRDKLNTIMQTEEYKLKQSVAKTGDKNGMWNPSLSEEEREKSRYHSRQYPGYAQFRRDVYNRDNYTCQTCGDDTGGNLVVHHLDGFHWAVELRTDVDNGVTLCDICHKTFHSQYGVRNNTKEQFEQYRNTALVTSTGAFSMH